MRNSPYFTFPNRFIPMTAKIQKKSISTLPTLTSAGRDTTSVLNRVFSPFALGKSCR